jgi:hypothetical protein
MSAKKNVLPEHAQNFYNVQSLIEKPSNITSVNVLVKFADKLCNQSQPANPTRLLDKAIVDGAHALIAEFAEFTADDMTGIGCWMRVSKIYSDKNAENKLFIFSLSELIDIANQVVSLSAMSKQVNWIVYPELYNLKADAKPVTVTKNSLVEIMQSGKARI